MHGYSAQELNRRLGKQCRERWFNHLDPDLKKDPFSAEEDATILRMKFSVGTKWAGIARELQGRTDNMVKNRYNSTLKRVMESLKAPLREEGVIKPGMSDADIGLACLQRMKEEGLLGPDINKMKTRPVHHKATTRNFNGSARQQEEGASDEEGPNDPPSPPSGRGGGSRRRGGSGSVTSASQQSSGGGTFGGPVSAPPSAVGGGGWTAQQQAHAAQMQINAMAQATSQGMVFGSPPMQKGPAGMHALPAGGHFLSPPTMNAAHFLSLMAQQRGPGALPLNAMSTASASQILHSSFAVAAAANAAAAKSSAPATSSAAAAAAPAPAVQSTHSTNSNAPTAVPVVPFAMTAGSRSASAASAGSDHGGPQEIGGGVRAVPTAGGGVVERPRARKAAAVASQAQAGVAPGSSEAGGVVVTPPRGAGGVPSPSGASSSGTEEGAALDDEDEATAESAAYLASLHPDMQGPEAADKLGAVWEEMGGGKAGQSAARLPASAKRAPVGGRHGVFSPQTPRVTGASAAVGVGRDSVERGVSYGGGDAGDKASGVEVPLGMNATPLNFPRTPVGNARGDDLAAAHALTGMASSGRRGVPSAAAGIAMRRPSRRPLEGGIAAAGRAPIPPVARRGVRRGALLGGALPPRPSNSASATATATSVSSSAAVNASTGLAPSPASVGGGNLPQTPLAMVTPNTVVALLASRSSTGKAGGPAQPPVREQRVRACVPRASLARAVENSPIPSRTLVYSSDDGASGDELLGARRGGVKRSLSSQTASRSKAARAI